MSYKKSSFQKNNHSQHLLTGHTDPLHCHGRPSGRSLDASFFRESPRSSRAPRPRPQYKEKTRRFRTDGLVHGIRKKIHLPILNPSMTKTVCSFSIYELSSFSVQWLPATCSLWNMAVKQVGADSVTSCRPGILGIRKSPLFSRVICWTAAHRIRGKEQIHSFTLSSASARGHRKSACRTKYGGAVQK